MYIFYIGRHYDIGNTGLVATTHLQVNSMQIAGMDMTTTK